MERIHTHHSHSSELIIPKDRNTTYLVVEGPQQEPDIAPHPNAGSTTLSNTLCSWS